MVKNNTVERVTEDLRAVAGSGPPGVRLPSVRELMARYGAGPSTVQRAVSRLVREGLVEARPGRGTFVVDRRRVEAPAPADLGWQSLALGGRTVPGDGLDELLAVPAPGVVPLTSGYLSEDLQPLSQLAAAAARAARRPGVWGRVPIEGLEGLRAWFARETGMRAGDVMVTSGGQSALSTAFRALCAPGSPVLMESPTYVGALPTARAAGLVPVPVPTDGDGVRPEALEKAFSSTGAKVFYCQPTYANPHGAVLSKGRREAVMEAVRAAGAFLVEDDSARDFALEGPPPPPLVAHDSGGHVVYVRSLTKSAAPGMRIAALCARGPAGARLKGARIVSDFFVAGPMQETALQFVTSPAWRRHLRDVKATLKDRRDALVEAVCRDIPQARLASVPQGGLHLWLELPEGTDDAEVAREAARAGVLVSPGRHWFPAEPTGSFLRLSYAGADAGVLSEGVSLLARVLDSSARRPPGSA